MRVCPKCGHLDPAYWLPSRWRTTEYCRIEDLESGEEVEVAELLKKVAPMEIVTDHASAYRMNEVGFVERVWIKMYESGGKSAFNLSREAHHFNPEYAHPSQQKLSDCPTLGGKK